MVSSVSDPEVGREENRETISDIGALGCRIQLEPGLGTALGNRFSRRNRRQLRLRRHRKRGDGTLGWLVWGQDLPIIIFGIYLRYFGFDLRPEFVRCALEFVEHFSDLPPDFRQLLGPKNQ